MTRRSFLAACAAGSVSADSVLRSQERQPAGLRADVLVAGGGVGGVAAALAACRAGRRVVLTEETTMLGGQLTSQAVPPDEHPWIEEAGCTRSYRAFREGVRRHYRENFPLTDAARADPRLNPGGGWVSGLCHEPRAAAAVIAAMLAPHVASGRLVILLGHRPVDAERRGDRIGAVGFADITGNRRRVVEAPYVLDATELGDLLPPCGVEHVTGAESRGDTGEPSAPAAADPLDQQAITWCFAVSHHPGEDHVIGRPDDYARWRDLAPALTPPWPGRLFAWENTHPVTLETRFMPFDPEGGGFPNLWNYRRIRDPRIFVEPAAFPSVCLVNWPQNDHWLGPLVGPGVDRALRETRMAEAKALSRAFLYWLQTDAPRPDGGTGWRGLRPAADVLGTRDGFAVAPYIREGRRILARFTVTELHVSTDARIAATRATRETVRAAPFADTVGVGAYRIDLHPGTGGRNYIDVSSLPFQIPLGALIPRRVANLLAAGKNLGVTHIANGCYRLHPVEWNIGEAAGVLAAHCLDRRLTPAAVHASPEHVAAFQDRLRSDGFELEWTVPVRPL